MNNLVNVCVDSYLDADVRGRFYTAYDIEPAYFNGIAELFLKMERFLDRLGFPMSSTRHRCFNGIITGKEDMDVIAKDNLSVPRGDTASFLVSVRFRQNSTWQGTLRWLDSKREVNFRSALELMRLIDSASSCVGSVWVDAMDTKDVALENMQCS